jgi:hypothetical protein
MGIQQAGEAGRLESFIRQRSFGRVRDLSLEVRDGGLVLRGRAPSYYTKQLAQQAVLEAGSLPLLANEIEVPGVSGP